MSKERPLISDAQIARIVDSILTTDNGEVNMERAAMAVRGMYENMLHASTNAVQRFVDHHNKWQGRGCIEADREWDDIIHDCHKAGYRPKP